MSNIERGVQLLTKEEKTKSINSLIAYFESERNEAIGVIAAEELIDFLIKDLGTNIYNKAIEDAKTTIKSESERLEYELNNLLK